MNTNASGEVSPNSSTMTDDTGISITLVDDEESGGEPSDNTDETNTTEEDTSTNDTQASDSQDDADDATTDKAEGEVNTKASKVISSLGEDKKVFAQQLIELAQTSDTNREVVANLVKTRPDVEKYFKSKFGEDYDRLFSESGTSKDSTADFDVETIRAEERAKAQADVIIQQYEKRKSAAIEEYAEQNGFTPEEAEELTKYVNLLGAESEFGPELLKKAGLVVNADKTSSKSMPSTPSKGDAGKPQVKKEDAINKNDPILQKVARQIGKDPDTLVKNLQEMDAKRTKDGSYILNFS